MKPKHVHFIGIGGYGMSAIASVLLDLGYHVTGSDVDQGTFVQRLMDRGAKIHIGHDRSNVDGAELVVYSTSIEKENVERVEAKRQGIEILHRSQMLARLLNDRKGIAVAGAHGKTTTTSMIAQILEESGVDPTYIVGGEIVALKGNAKAGKSEYVVAEADESDGSFLEYEAHIAVVTNIEADHLENYGGDFKRLKEAYRQFLRQVSPSGVSVLCAEDAHLREMAGEVQNRLVTYALTMPADFIATQIKENAQSTRFVVQYQGDSLGEIILQIPGKHNILNALAAVVVCLEIGVSFEDIARSLSQFKGAKRRFQVIGEFDNILVVDDYAHHPTEIKATLSGAKALGRRMIAIFQPQRYSRTHLLLEEFSRSFSLADEVIIHTIYAPPGEAPIPGITAQRVAELTKKNSNPNTQFMGSKEEIIQYLIENARPGDLVITMGAGDVWRVSHGFVDKCKQQGTKR